MEFEVELLDLRGANPGKRPEFLVRSRGAPVLLHEDKGLLSAGALALTRWTESETRVDAHGLV